MKSGLTKHLFPIIDAMVDKAVIDLERKGRKIACRQGCSDCCHLLVEISWEEAEALADWLEELAPIRRERFITNIRTNAATAKLLFEKSARTQRFLKPFRGRTAFPDGTYDQYFFGSKKPCPFLEFSQCAAYEQRPTACRLHMVTSDPAHCSAEVDDEEEYEIPRRIERLKEESAPAINAIEFDRRWGQMGIMVEAVLVERGVIVEEGVVLERVGT